MHYFQFALLNRLQPGDVIICRGRFGVRHYVIYLGLNADGQHIYADNTRERGVAFFVEWRFLFDNEQILEIRRMGPCLTQRREAVKRAQSLWRAQYHLTKFNCEHYANYVQYNESFSVQAEKGENIAVAISLTAFVIGILSPRKSA